MLGGQNQCFTKTPLTLKLADNSKYYFLSQLRRFGKYLFMDTSECLFKGRKELFKCLFVYDKWGWGKEHPVMGKVTRDAYIQAYRPEYAALQYANEHLEADAKIFGLYIGNRGYYSDRHIEFPIERLQQAAALAESGQDVARALHDQGFTHLLVNVSLFNYWVQKNSLHERRMLKDFFDAHTVEVFSKDKHSLLRIQ